MAGCAWTFPSVVFYMLPCVLGFNIDTEFPVIFRGKNDSYFGFTVALLTLTEEPLALIAAPQTEYLLSQAGYKTGVLYKCEFHSTNCSEVQLDSPWDLTGKNEYNEPYKELKKNMFLGVSLDTQPGSRENFVVCGHKWKENRPEVYFLNGACYAVNNSLNKEKTTKLLPLNAKKLQFRVEEAGPINYYVHGMAGFSVAYTEDGTHLLLGAPGVFEGIGSIIDYTMGSRFQLPYILKPEKVQEEILTNASYIGYSVSSGKFFAEAETSYVAGAPRAENDIGCVYIFEQFSPSGSPIIQEKLKGEQIGEYYGYAILGVNVNGDSYTDLLVGAPFHSKSSTNFDTGRVYVYISDGTSLNKQNRNLEGPKKQNARFGTAINDAGDLNMDGYIDVAVGAPYEDDIGAVYIYHGTEEGINPEYVQRIVPSQLKVDLTGFGFSISKAKDIDSNSYSDLLIGAYSSDSAVLLRSYPVISVRARMEFNSKHIIVNSSDCEINGKKESCIIAKYCLEYFGKDVPAKVNMKIHFKTDTERDANPRTYLINETSSERPSKIETDTVLYVNQDNCFTEKVYVKRNIDDFITPIQFQLIYDVKNQSTQQFCKRCPVLDKGQTNMVTQEVMVWTGCGDDNECSCDLKVQVSVGDHEIVIGERKHMIVNITTSNQGEHAYKSVVYVCMQHYINIINMGECSFDDYDPTSFCVKCSIGNPLKSLESKSLLLKLDPSNLPLNLTQFKLYAISNTSSNEIYPSDNNFTLSVPVLSKAGIRLIGSTLPEVVYLNPEKNQTKELVLIKHKYIVAKFMPSPVSSVNVILSVPVKLEVGQEAFFVTGIPNITKPSGINGNCYHGNASDYLQLNHRKNIPSDHNKDDFDTTVVSCRTAICHVYHCIIGPFANQEVVTLEIIGFMNLKSLQEAVGKRDITFFVTEGAVKIEDENIQEGISQKTDYTFVTTKFERKGLQKMGKLALWIIIVSVIAGILLLILLIGVLIKVGFFRRKEREEMNSMAENDSLLNKEKHPEGSPNENMKLYDDKPHST